MKKIILVTSMLCFVFIATAQQTPTNKKPVNKTQQRKNTTATGNTGDTTANNNKAGTDTSISTGTTGTGNAGNTGTIGTGTTGTGTTGTTGVDQNNADASGTMTSTGRYQAMGVTTGNLHRKDAKFIVMAASSNNLELQLSQLAQQRATSQAVRDFAAMMVEHHTMAAQQMKTLLSSKGASVPDTALLPMHRLQMESVTAAQGADFDKAYMRIMVDAHEEDVDEYEDETTDARDADIRAFTTRMLPTLRTHYARAKEVRQQVK
ncbi:MAG TPA: DUF4142 domain-containing protein [Flavisolibacter sp.]|jgi:putative membrane protein|nr:DUF4142 domain-containing protein [Flavisolibacter sp.]